LLDYQNSYNNTMEINSSSSCKSIPSLLLLKNKRRNSSYQKVENQKRIKLCELVFVEGYLLKNAAKELNINYSTAKTIVRNFKLEKRVVKKIPNSIPLPEEILDEESGSEKLKEMELIQKVFVKKPSALNGSEFTTDITQEQISELKAKIDVTNSQYKEFVNRMDLFCKLVYICLTRITFNA
jgi:transposase